MDNINIIFLGLIKRGEIFIIFNIDNVSYERRQEPHAWIVFFLIRISFIGLITRYFMSKLRETNLCNDCDKLYYYMAQVTSGKIARCDWLEREIEIAGFPGIETVSGACSIINWFWLFVHIQIHTCFQLPNWHVIFPHLSIYRVSMFFFGLGLFFKVSFRIRVRFRIKIWII